MPGLPTLQDCQHSIGRSLTATPPTDLGNLGNLGNVGNVGNLGNHP
jgi:hypothetical protein